MLAPRVFNLIRGTQEGLRRNISSERINPIYKRLSIEELYKMKRDVLTEFPWMYSLMENFDYSEYEVHNIAAAREHYEHTRRWRKEILTSSGLLTLNIVPNMFVYYYMFPEASVVTMSMTLCLSLVLGLIEMDILDAYSKALSVVIAEKDRFQDDKIERIMETEGKK